MVTTAVKSATLVQIGKETTRGTAVAATRRLLLKGDATYRFMEEFDMMDGQMHGTLARATVAPVLTRNGTEFDIVTDVDFDQILAFCLSGLKGVVTPTTPGTGEGRLWTFTPPAAADPLPETYTLEYAERNFAATPDELSLEAPYAFTTEIELGGGNDGIPQLRVKMVARETTLTASTASLTLPTVEFPAQARWAVYIDGTWANLGTTQITGQVLGLTWRFSDFLRPDYYLDNRAQLDFSQYQYTPRVVDLSIDATLDPAASKLVVTEDGSKTAGTTRFIRLQLNGSAFDAPDGTLNRYVRIDGAYVHMPDSMEERGRDRDGNVVVPLHLQSIYDATQAQDVEVSVQNTLATFP